MKWIYLSALLVFTPFLVGLLRSRRDYLPHAALALGLMPFLEARFHLVSAPISWAGWAGPVQGIEFSITDAIAFAMLVVSRSAKSPLLLKFSFGLLCAAFAVSTVASGAHMESFFIGWEILRTVLIYLAVMRASVTNKDVPLGLFSGFIVGVVTQTIVGLNDYAHGASQTGAWFGHQNLLGFVAHPILYPALAAFLGGFYRKRMLLAVVCCLIIAFVGASRATIAFMLAGILLTMAFSIWHRSTGRKSAVAAAMLLGVLMVSPALYMAVQRRPAEQREGSNRERVAMTDAARMIIADYPLGTGANRYVITANLGGYDERAGVPWNPANRAAPVHDSYYLVTAEMSILGLLALLSFFASGFLIALRGLRRAPPSFGGELAAGTAVAFVIVAIHANYEWIFMLHAGHAILAMPLGVVAALSVLIRPRQLSWAKGPTAQLNGPAKPVLSTGS